MQNIMLIALAAGNTLLICLSQIALWQRKEYRLDRMRAYMLSPEGTLKKQYFVIASGVLLLLGWMTSSELLATASLLSNLSGHALRIYKRGVMRPDFTMRAILAFICTGIVSVVWFMIVPHPSDQLAMYLASFVFSLPLLIALSVYIVGIPAHMQKQRMVTRARVLRSHLKNLTVVGITGSVGKTSTKTYLTHLLGGESEALLATSKHRNSPYSVAQDMVSRISQKTVIYIAELAAYIPGEIKELAELTKPTVAIIPAITNQHVALFGSVAALIRTKWELIDALPENGVAILNKDDENISTKAKGLTKKIYWFSLQGQADVYATDIVVQRDHTICTLSIGDEKKDIRLPLVSRGQLVPVLAAVTAAHALGIDFETVIKRLTDLPQLARTMELRKGKAGVTVVDDSYSASEASVSNAIEYLTVCGSADSRLVLVPVIELGSEGTIVHERIGHQLSNISVRVCIYGDSYREDIIRGLGENPKAIVTWHTDVQDMETCITEGITSETVIVLEGRIPSKIRESVL